MSILRIIESIKEVKNVPKRVSNTIESFLLNKYFFKLAAFFRTTPLFFTFALVLFAPFKIDAVDFPHTLLIVLKIIFAFLSFIYWVINFKAKLSQYRNTQQATPPDGRCSGDSR